MPGLKVVCLISGGKDSAFSILHCLANGHDVIALANLHPAYDANQETPDDMDSYMYQTIGHAIIPLYEEAFSLPLYRQAIIGSAINQDKSYGPSAAADHDESESLMPLLLKVKADHPEVNAVSTGAILSDYQRTRVESVAARLGLTSLAYLWQYSSLPPCTQTSLLEDMAAVGQDSRIIKVASGGLDDSFLWQNVADSKTINRLDKASRRFGSEGDGAVLGEGGEYETLAVAGPAPLWKCRIVVEPDHRKVVTGDAGSASLHITTASLEPDTRGSNTPTVRMPPLLEPRFETMLTEIQVATSAHAQRDAELSSHTREMKNLRITNGLHENKESDSETNSHMLLQSLTGTGTSAAEQMRSIMDAADQSLLARGCTFADVTYTSIVIRDMDDFLAVNAVYGTYFQHPNPPARITIACAAVLPTDKELMVSFTMMKLSNVRLRKGLYVQSRSYWAPANIGPYSQAISVPTQPVAASEADGLVYISGQIPLVPASMELPTSFYIKSDDPFLCQCILALQHAVRVGRAMQIQRFLNTIVFIVADSSELAKSRSHAAHDVWRSFHCDQDASEIAPDDSDDPSFDVWNFKYGQAEHHGRGHGVPEVEGTTRTDIPRMVPALYIIRTDALPRNASVEWVTFGLTKEFDASPGIPHFDHLLQVFKANIVAYFEEEPAARRPAQKSQGLR